MKNSVRRLDHNLYGKVILVTKIDGNTVTCLSNKNMLLLYERKYVESMPVIGTLKYEKLYSVQHSRKAYRRYRLNEFVVDVPSREHANEGHWSVSELYPVAFLELTKHLEA